MRIKSLALATTLSLLSTSALVGTVHAQKGITLQPQGNWAVKRVNADSPNSYCALARRFKQDLILTLAKNDKHEISLAIDFPQGRFSSTQRYEISLDPGAGEQRKFKVNPASSGKAFVLRVGSDQKFMSALLRTGYLRVVVENESYNFNLADIDQGREQLDACLYSGMTPAAGGGNAQAVPSYTQVADLRAEKEKLEQRLQKLEQENESLRLRAEASVNAKAEDANSPDSLSALKVTRSPAVDGLLAQITSLKNENAELRKLAEAPKNSVPDSKDVSVIELARENQRLQSLLEERGNAEDYKQQIEQLTQRVSSLEAENLSLVQQKSSGLSGEEKKNLERQIMALTSENDALRDSIAHQGAENSDDVAAVKQELSGLEQENAQLNSRISTLMREKSDVIEQLAYYEEENDRLRSAATDNSSDTALLSQLRDEIRKIEGRNARLLAQKETEISALQSDLQALKTEQARMAASSDEAKREAEKAFKAQIAALDIKNEALKEELVLLSKDQTVLDDFRNKVDGLTEEKRALQSKLDNAQVKISDLQKQIEAQKAEKAQNENDKVALDQKISDLNTQIGALEASVSDLSAENKSLQAELSERSGTDRELMDGYKEELAGLKAENKALRDELAAQDSDQKAEADKVASLLNENAELRAQLEDIESKNLDKVSALEESLNQLKKANATLREEAELKTSSLEDELSRLRDQLDSANNQDHVSLELKDQKIASLEDRLRTLESENQDLTLALNNANSFNEELQKDWSETLASYNSLKKEYETEALAENINGNKDAARIEQSERLAALQEKNKELNKQLEAQAREYLVLVRDMEALKAQKSNANAQSVSASPEEIVALRKNNKLLNSEIDVLREKLARADLPQVREAGLRQDEKPSSQMDEEARRKRDEDLQQKQRQTEREAISRLAATEPAAGGGEDTMKNDKAQARQNSPSSEVAERGAIRDVIEELHMEDANLSEAQKLERSLKNQIERSVNTPTESSQRQALSDEPVSKGIEPIEPVMQESIAEMRSASDDEIAVEAVQQKSADGLFAPSVNVAELLAAANIDLAAPVSLVGNSSGADRVAYQWRSVNDLYGSAHQKQISNINEFDIYVRDYLTMTEERCTGDFAIIPSSTDQVGQTRIDSYEIACVGNGVNSSASVVFFNSDDTFTVLAHEGPTEGMEMAMDARDKIVSTVDKT